MVLHVSHDTKVLLAIISVVTSTIGILFAAIFFGLATVICSLIVLIAQNIEFKLEKQYKIMAIIALYLGILEVVVGILVVSGVITF